MSTDSNSPATKADLKALEEKLVETMRDMQTELLRGFVTHNNGLNVRMRKLEADQNNLDSATSVRLTQLEEQVTAMNIRLMRVEGPR